MAPKAVGSAPPWPGLWESGNPGRDFPVPREANPHWASFRGAGQEGFQATLRGFCRLFEILQAVGISSIKRRPQLRADLRDLLPQVRLRNPQTRSFHPAGSFSARCRAGAFYSPVGPDASARRRYARAWPRRRIRRLGWKQPRRLCDDTAEHGEAYLRMDSIR